MAILSKLSLLMLTGTLFFCQLILADSTPLRPDQAFRVQAELIAPQTIKLHWHIEDDYYLYRDKFTFQLVDSLNHITARKIPAGHNKHDAYFGDVEIMRNDFVVALELETPSTSPLSLNITYQGCWDGGICYPPQSKTLILSEASPNNRSPATSSSPLAKLSQSLETLTQRFLGKESLLPAEQAFQFTYTENENDNITFRWDIAKGYYLYRDQISVVSAEGNVNWSAEQLNLPSGSLKDDPEYGSVEIYRGNVSLTLPSQILAEARANNAGSLTVHYQGCADRGVCYPPMQSVIPLSPPVAVSSNQSTATLTGEPAPNSEQDIIADKLANQSFFLSMASFFGFGLLLAFTPCIFPMIPILSGIIVGQGKAINSRKAFILSLTYVLASALVYTVFGLLAGLYGANIQIAFQQPVVITLFSLVFVLLALSMFGFYELQLPSGLQTRLSQVGSDKAGSIVGAAIMGALSSLIVGPCVAAPLAGALVFIGQTGDALLGGAALFSMGLGMGLPLIIIGTSAGHLLPSAGAWMDTVKQTFGVILLGLAIWFMSRILPGPMTLFCWATLTIGTAVFMGVTTPTSASIDYRQRLKQTLSIILLSYGILMLIGAAAGNHNPLYPLASNRANSLSLPPQTNAFIQIDSLQQLEAQLSQAEKNGQTIMLDFYADWCVSCIEMEEETFNAPVVAPYLKQAVLIQADVTANTLEHQAILKRFGLVGPPAILFFPPGEQEFKNHRVIGFMPPEQFAAHLRQVLKNDD